MRTVPLAVAALATVCLATSPAPAPPGTETAQDPAGLDQYEVALPIDSEVDSMALTPDGLVVLGGVTGSDAFPVTPGAVQAQCDHSQYGYCRSPVVMVFSPGGELLYSTFAGGASQRSLHSAAAAPDGGIWVLLGATYRSPDPVFGGCSPHQPVLARIRPGRPGYDRYVCVGGTNAYGLHAAGVALAGDGSIWVVGQAAPDSALHTVNAWQPAAGGSADVFAIRYGAGGQETILATYIGGRDLEYPSAAAVAPDGDLVIAGRTQSFDFPAVRALQTRLGGARPYIADAFITRLDAGGRWLEYSTWLGGTEGDGARGVSVDASGNAYVVGDTSSPDVPVTAGTAGARLWPGPWSGFLASVDPTGRLRVSTRVAEWPRCVTARGDGSVSVVGATYRADFPRAGRAPRLWPSKPFAEYPFFLQTDALASALSRSTLVPVATGLDPKVHTPTPMLGIGNRIEAAAFDADYLYLAGQTMLWYRPYPESDSIMIPTGHYLRKWYIGDPAGRGRGRERR